MPSGLVIPKLGVQATASSDSVNGVICLKISLPREHGAKSSLSRYGLFPGKPPSFTSTPSIYPIPLPAHPSPHVTTASTLLGLPFDHQHSTSTSTTSKPYIDVSNTTGQVFIVDPTSGHGARRDMERKDWLVVIPFQIEVENIIGGVSKILLPLPKCLDNVIRLQILPPHSSSSSLGTLGEVSILTEPKMLALPPSCFDSPRRRVNSGGHAGRKGKGSGNGSEKETRNGNGNGVNSLTGVGDWEDEASDDDSEAEGSWLEGRFQSTDTLRLEWSFTGSSLSSATPNLQVRPQWDPKHPSISIQYETTIQSNSSIVPIEIVLPDGWGWKALSMSGDDLVSWRSIDGDWWDEVVRQSSKPDGLFDDDNDDDGSFSTVRHRSGIHTRPSRPPVPTTMRSPPTPTSSHSSASLMRQTLPTPAGMKMEDFSFELSGLDDSPPPLTPMSKMASTPTSIPRPQPVSRIRETPVSCALFDLTFDDDVGETDKSFSIQGNLVPLSGMTFVSPTLDLLIPFIKSDDQMSTSSANATTCEVNCPEATYHRPVDTGTSSRVTCDTGSTSIGTFKWTNSRGEPLNIPQANTGVVEKVKIRVMRGTWGQTSFSASFPWPKRAKEVGFDVPRKGDVVHATMGGVDIPRATLLRDVGMHVRLGQGGRREGACDVVLEFDEDDHDEGSSIPLPQFSGGNGIMTVELRGEGWSDVVKGRYRGNLTRVSSMLFTYDMPSPSPPLVYFDSPSSSPSINAKSVSSTASSPALLTNSGTLSTTVKTRASTLFSWNIFINLFLLWLLLSMAQQVQRLRNEVAFVVSETRDLRMYGMAESGSDIGTGTGPGMGALRKTEEGPFGMFGSGAGHDHGDGEDRNSEGRGRTDVAIKENMALGRVVLGGSIWDTWKTHPTVRTMRKSIGWLWQAVLWLVVRE